MTTLLLAGLLLWAPDTRAEAYPDQPSNSVAPDCADIAAPATVTIDGGDVSNTTTLDLSADGGTAIGDSSGGDDNLATTGGDRDRKDNDKGRNKHDAKSRKDRNESETAAAGNGGLSDARADGGAIAVENVNSGGNVGSAIAVGDTLGGYGGYGGYDPCGYAVGGVFIDGGTVSNETIITVSADGGTAIADASGGDRNIASTGGRAGNGGTSITSAGNGGVATASADGGAISIGDINSGGNAGNAIGVGDTVAAPPVCCVPPPAKPVPVVPVVPVKPVKPVPAPAPSARPPGKLVVVTTLPSTGTGASPAGQLAASMALVALATGTASTVVRRRMV